MELHHGCFFLSAVSFFHRYTVAFVQNCLVLLVTWLLKMGSYSQGKDEIFVSMCKGTDLLEFRLLVNSFLYVCVQCNTL